MKTFTLIQPQSYLTAYDKETWMHITCAVTYLSYYRKIYSGTEILWQKKQKCHPSTAPCLQHHHLESSKINLSHMTWLTCHKGHLGLNISVYKLHYAYNFSAHMSMFATWEALTFKHIKTVFNHFQVLESNP